MRRIEGEVLRLRCRTCSAAFPSFEFCGDTDMVTDGLGAVTSCTGDEIVVAEMLALEWRDQSGHLFAQSIRDERQGEFRFVRCIAHEGGYTPPAGVGYKEFQRTYRAPQPLFACIFLRRRGSGNWSREPRRFSKEGRLDRIHRQADAAASPSSQLVNNASLSPTADAPRALRYLAPAH